MPRFGSSQRPPQLGSSYVSLETIRNWEQGKRSPTGAAKALLRLLDKAPELALLALR